MDEFDTEPFDTEGFDAAGFDTEDFETSRSVFRQREFIYGVGLPLAALVIVIAVVSGLVFAGVIQGHEIRAGAEQPPTTRSTVLIVP